MSISFLSPEWDILTLEGQKIPGKATVSCDYSLAIEVKKAKGFDGAEYTDNGKEASKVTIEIWIWSSKEWEDFQSIIPLILSRKGIESPPLTIDHPVTSMYGVTRIKIKSLGEPRYGKDGIRIKIEAIEYIPAPKKKAANAGKKKDTPVGNATAAQAEEANKKLLQALQQRPNPSLRDQFMRG